MKNWLKIFCTVLLLGVAGTAQAEEFYSVRKGDTLLSRFGPKAAPQVCKLNKLQNCDRIVVGQKLLLPDNVGGLRITDSQPPRPSCVNLGATPWNKYGSTKLRLQGIERNSGLTAEEKVEAKAKVQAGVGESILLTSEMRFSTMSSRGKNGQPVFVRNVEVCTPEKGGRVEVTRIWKLSTGTVLAEPVSCGNIGTIVLPPVVAKTTSSLPASVAPSTPLLVVEGLTPTPAPVALVPSVTAESTPAPLPPLSAFAEPRDAFEWEVIAGAGVWDNNLANGTWQYGEAMLSAILPDGYRLGIGLFAMKGAGDSKLSTYHWNERAYGPQVGFKRNFLKNQLDQFGQQSELPAQFGIKLRYLDDSAKGGDRDSGYAMKQTGHKVGLSVEYAERRSEDLTVGVNAEVWRYSDGQITSTWAGDKPQDRGSANLNLWAQYRHSDDWQSRGVLGLSHQNWDALNYFRLSVEARYKETVMCGPSLALALNKPEAYAQVARHDLTTLGFACRLELGGVIRTLDREKRENGVEYVGPVPSAP